LFDGAYRARHPNTWEHSWLGRSGNGYRIDHIFVTRQHAAQIHACGYLQAPRQLGLTDHAAMASCRGCGHGLLSSLHPAGLKDVDGLGELPGAPGAAAEFAQDAPGLRLGAGAFAG
jgi:hypothetical protein